MRLEPRDSWIEIVKITQEEERQENLLVLPEDFKRPESAHQVVMVVTDPRAHYVAGDKVIVPTHVIRDVEVEGRMFHLVEVNHVMAKVKAK
jgi:co-chaperonin GroES (HSP10)